MPKDPELGALAAPLNALYEDEIGKLIDRACGVNPADSVLETRQFPLEEIAKAFGVPLDAVKPVKSRAGTKPTSP